MVRRPQGPADTSAQEVVRRLRATGSSDPDVLYAAREELSAPFDRHRRRSALVVTAGVLVCLTIVLIPVGVAIVIAGVRYRRQCALNLAIIETAHTRYVAMLAISHARFHRRRDAFGRSVLD
jgi:hypothetical protein